MIKSDKDVANLKPVLATSLDDSPGLLVQTGTTLLYGLHFANAAAALTYIQLFNAAALTDVTLGTTVPDMVVVLPTSLTADMDFTKPVIFDKGLVAFSTTTATGSTAALSHGTFLIG